MRIRLFQLAGFLLTLVGSLTAAGTVTTYTSRPAFGGNAIADWGGLGSTSGSGVIIGGAFTNLQASSPSAIVSGTTADFFARVDQGDNYFGNFAPQDRLLITTAPAARGQIAKAPGPMRFTFNTPVFGAGLQVSTNVPGAFTATLKAFDTQGTIVGTQSAAGISTTPLIGDNSAPFLAIRSSVQEIAAIEVDVPGATGVTVNRMDIALTANVVVSTTSASLGKVTTYTTALSYGGDAVADWGALGPTSGAQVVIGSFAGMPTTAPGITVAGTSATSELARVDEGVNYSGNFAPGDKLLLTSGVAPRGGLPPKAPGPIRFTFSAPVYGVGLQISTNTLGPFVATMKAFNSGGTLLASVSTPGVSTLLLTGDNSAPFLGIRSSASEIAAVEVDVPGLTGVAVNKLRLALSGSLLTIDSFFVSTLYSDLWNVLPNAAAVATLSGELAAGLTTRQQVAESFYLDPQAQLRGMFIVKCYLAALLQDPDFPGWQSILRVALTSGATQNTILAGFMTSPGAVAIWGDPTCVDGAAGCTSDAVFVPLLYQKLLGRAPEPAGLAYWIFLLGGRFLSRTDAMMGFIQSPEFTSRTAARANANLLYLEFLRRTGEPAGLNFWTTELQLGVPLLNVIQGFISSPEYLARF